MSIYEQVLAILNIFLIVLEIYTKSDAEEIIYINGPIFLIFFADTILSNMFKSPGRHVQVEALPPLDDQSKLLCTHALTTLSQYFSWIPLSSTITPQLLSTIFHFAGFGCETKSSSSSSNFNTNTQSLGILAMNCINELLSKNCVPVEFEDFLLQMFQQTFYLLQKLTKDSSTNSTGNRLSEIDEGYVDILYYFC